LCFIALLFYNDLLIVCHQVWRRW